MRTWMDRLRLRGLTRGNQILLVVLVVQLILVGVAFWPRSAAVASGEPLLPGLDPLEVVRVTITDKEGSQIVLAKELGNWVLPGADAYPCQEEKITELLDQVAGLTSDRLVTQTRASHERLGVARDEYEMLLQLEGSDGQAYELYIGTSPRYQVSHVRVADEDQVYLVSGVSSSTVSPRASAWIDTQYMTLSQDEIVGLSLENANGQFEFTKVGGEEEGEEATWTMAGLAPGEVLNENPVVSMVSGLSNLRMVRPLGKEELEAYGLQDPVAAIRIRVPDEEGGTKAYVVRVGAHWEDETAYVVKSGMSPYYVLVSEYTANLWIDKTRDDFAQVPTPTPEPTPESTS